MNHRRLAAVSVLSGVLPLAACGTAEESPGADPAAAGADVHVLGWPWVDAGADRAAAGADVHVLGWPWVDAGADRAAAPAADPAAASWSGDAKDHPGYRSPYDATAAASWSGDAKDHPGYGAVDSPTADYNLHFDVGDAKDHPGYGR